MNAQMQLATTEKMYLITVAAFRTLDSVDIEDAIDSFPWTDSSYDLEPISVLGSLGSLGYRCLGLNRFSIEFHRGKNEQPFFLAHRNDGKLDLVAVPEKEELRNNNFASWSLSEKLELFRRNFSPDKERRGHADFNVVLIPDITVRFVGWASVRDCVMRFLRSDLGEITDPAAALNWGGRYLVDDLTLRVGRARNMDALRVDIVD